MGVVQMIPQTSEPIPRSRLNTASAERDRVLEEELSLSIDEADAIELVAWDAGGALVDLTLRFFALGIAISKSEHSLRIRSRAFWTNLFFGSSSAASA